MRDREQGAWFEGKIVRIVLDPDVQYESETVCESLDHSDIHDKESDLENKPPNDSSEEDTKSKRKGIAKYFTKAGKGRKQTKEVKMEKVKVSDENILYKVQLDAELVTFILLLLTSCSNPKN